MQKRGFMKKARYIVATISFIVFLACLVYILIFLVEGYDNRKQREQLKERINSIEEINKSNELSATDGNNTANETSKTNGVSTTNGNGTADENGITDEIGTSDEADNIISSEEVIAKEMIPKYQTLYDENSDFIGWISIDETEIDYPVMHVSGDNHYYINHNFDKEKERHGSLFLDESCDVLLPSTNYMIYGHNMKDGTMFHDLRYYKEKSYYEKHKMIHFDTIYEDADYEIIAIFLSEVYNKDEDIFKYYQFIQADNENEFNDYIKNIKALSLYKIDVTAEYGDQLLTLSTCDYSNENGRMAVVARKIK